MKASLIYLRRKPIAFPKVVHKNAVIVLLQQPFPSIILEQIDKSTKILQIKQNFFHFLTFFSFFVNIMKCELSTQTFPKYAAKKKLAPPQYCVIVRLLHQGNIKKEKQFLVFNVQLF